jgi:hypothetical protein
MVATRNFVLHLGEMFLAMVVGMAALDAVFEGILAVAGSSYAVLVDDAPTAVALILMFNMTAPMLLWMRVRGHDVGEVSVMGPPWLWSARSPSSCFGCRRSTPGRSAASSAA